MIPPNVVWNWILTTRSSFRDLIKCVFRSAGFNAKLLYWNKWYCKMVCRGMLPKSQVCCGSKWLNNEYLLIVKFGAEVIVVTHYPDSSWWIQYLGSKFALSRNASKRIRTWYELPLTIFHNVLLGYYVIFFASLPRYGGTKCSRGLEFALWFHKWFFDPQIKSHKQIHSLIFF